MTDLINAGEQWLNTKREALLTRSVTYYRGVNSVKVDVTVGRTPFRINDEYGVSTIIESRDYLITAADLIILAAVILPEPGDTIKEVVGSEVFVYTVMAPGGEPEYRFSDRDRRILRIHTKHTDTE